MATSSPLQSLRRRASAAGNGLRWAAPRFLVMLAATSLGLALATALAIRPMPDASVIAIIGLGGGALPAVAATMAHRELVRRYES